MEAQIQNAVEIAWNPTLDQALKKEAFDFLQQVRADPSAWPACLTLFTQEPRAPDVVRHVTLEVVTSAVQAQQLDRNGSAAARDSLMDYVRRIYHNSSQRLPQDSASILNKLAQTLVSLFQSLYADGWTTFFQDLWQLAEVELRKEQKSCSATLFYLRILATVHDDIADQLIQTTREKAKVHAELKDLMRERDAARIANSWQIVLSRWQSIDPAVTELCLKTMGRYVSWSDIALIANEQTLQYLFQIAGQQNTGHPESGQSRTRDAAINVFTESVAKKMSSHDKVELLRFMNLETLAAQLVNAPPLYGARGTPDYDTDMGETVARLVNHVMLEIVEVLNDEKLFPESRQVAGNLLSTFTPHVLRFLSDEYDEICSTVVPGLLEQLALFRKIAKAQGTLPSPYNDMLPPVLSALVAKMRYDDTSFWGGEDEETDEAEFQELRKRLRVAQQNIATINEPLYLDTLGDFVETVFQRYRDQPQQVGWRDLEVALVEMVLLGELAVRNSGLYQKKLPSSAGSYRLIHLMTMMMDSSVATFDHPAVDLQVMDLCVKYHAFFDQQPQYITKALEDFVRFVHSDNVKVRAMSWHSFLRFVQRLRAQLGQVSETIVNAIRDLLVVKAEVPTLNDDGSLSSSQTSEDTTFQSQLHLFEAAGCLTSAPHVPLERQVRMIQNLLAPLRAGLEANINAATNCDERSILQVHHLIEAIGTLAKGVSEWMPGKANTSAAAPVCDKFQQVADAVLNALSTLKTAASVREGSRFAFSRLIGVLGVRILEQLPQWVDGLLSGDSSKDEISLFLRLLDQVIYGFKAELYDMIDTLLTPLLQRIFAGLSEQTHGTDDELQLIDLRREYLNFLLIVLNGDYGLEGVLVSNRNQPLFETIITSIEHYAKDTSESNDSKLALAVCTKMCDTWGGAGATDADTNGAISASPRPSLPGFDQFMISRFSSLTWSVMTNPNFRTKDSTASRALAEIALLQQIILAKNGEVYLNSLKQAELPNLGLKPPAIQDYIHALSTMDAKGFKQWLVNFLAQNRAS